MMLFQLKVGKIRNKMRAGGVLLACFSLLLSAGAGQAASLKDITPEVVSRVWMDKETTKASVSINGQDVLVLVDKVDGTDATIEAEEIAIRLQELLSDKKFDPAALSTVNEQQKIVLKAGNSVLAEIPTEYLQTGAQNKPNASDGLGARLVSVLRSSIGWLPPASNPAADPDISSLADSGLKFSGHASWYGGRFHGRKTSTGCRFDMDRLTAAHRTLPFGTKVLVRNRSTGASCVVEVNDRGPFIDGRVIDLSKEAARRLNMLSAGVALVDCMVLAEK